MLRTLIFFAKILLVIGLVVSSCLIYLFYHYGKDLPDYSHLDNYYPASVTRMYSSDGKLIEEYAREHRIFVPISSIPKPLIEAFVAAEDKNFYDHPGIDIFSIIRAAITNISHLMNHQRVEGGSTITQQVVKNFLLTSERSIARKVKEAILSYRITQIFSKEQILELYLNQIYLGKGAYGVASAALAYFNKSVEELTISESAVLASLPKAPSKFSPDKNYERAMARKNYVIGRMYDDGYITEEQARDAINQPIILAKHDKVQTIDADYYAEKVREEVIGMFDQEYFYTAGLTIITCVDSKMQKAAREALRFGIRKFDFKKGYRGPLKHGVDLKNWQEILKTTPKPPAMLEYELAVVLDVKPQEAKIGLVSGKTDVIYLKDMLWARTIMKSVSDILKNGDLIVIGKNDQKKYILAQIPEVNGGVMVVDHSNGRVLAAEGGYDFSVSKFDRTTQALRQPGSLAKTFIYLTAIENGVKPTDIFNDAPIVIHQGPGMPVWRPKNYNSEYLGPITLRQGLEKSRNMITIRISELIGLTKIINTLKRFGVNDNPPKVRAMVLGAVETTLDRMVMAYSAIANHGKKVTPHYIELIKDRKGNVIYRRDFAECPKCKDFDPKNPVIPELPEVESEQIMDEGIAYQMTSILKGVVERGTSKSAQVLQKVIAGKTGTTNDSKDTWFVGFTPRILVGTYIGYDAPRTMGRRLTGATVALPVFINFMQNAYAEIPSLDFIMPDSIKLVPIDYQTGKPSTAKNAIMEAFVVKSSKKEQEKSNKSEDTQENEVPEKINKDTISNQDQHESNSNYEIDSQSPSEEDNFPAHDPFERIEEKDPSQEVY